MFAPNSSLPSNRFLELVLIKLMFVATRGGTLVGLCGVCDFAATGLGKLSLGDFSESDSLSLVISINFTSTF